MNIRYFIIHNHMTEFKQWLEAKEPTKAWWRYGNYCGPGPELSSTCDTLADNQPLPIPKNQVDAACQAHDIDYCKCNTNWFSGMIGNKGTPCSRQADDRILLQLTTLSNNPELTWGERQMAKILYRYFQTHGKIQKRKAVQLNGTQSQ